MKKHTVLIAAVKLAETGLENLTVANLAVAMNCTASSLYYHFPKGREQLRSETVNTAIRLSNSRVIVQLLAIGDLAVSREDWRFHAEAIFA